MCASRTDAWADGVVVSTCLSLIKKENKNKNELDWKKRKNVSIGDGGSCGGVDVASIFSGKVKRCLKGSTAAGMFMGVLSDALLSDHQSTKFASRRRLDSNRERVRSRKRV